MSSIFGVSLITYLFLNNVDKISSDKIIHYQKKLILLHFANRRLLTHEYSILDATVIQAPPRKIMFLRS